MWNSGRLLSMIATASPRPTPSSARPPATASTRARSWAQVNETRSSAVRTAMISGCAAAVRRSASVIVGASTADASGRVIVLLSILCRTSLRSRLPHGSPSHRGAAMLSGQEAASGQSRDVVTQPDHENDDDQDKPDRSGPLHDLEPDPPPPDLLGQRPEDVTAVERGARDQIHHTH